MTMSEAKRRGNDKYNAKCDYIAVKPLKPEGEAIRAAAKTAGQSLQGYILQAVRRKMWADAAGEYLIRISKSEAEANAAKENQSLEDWLADRQ
ncbi:hypothetical protein JQM64_11515 [Fournierella massiliensis]|nr:hypothetical protein [Fournierella massiliensis]MCF2558139.1 hypothetical protein [Fournierella massiliensis]